MTNIDREKVKMLKILRKAETRLTKLISGKPSYDSLQSAQFDLKFIVNLMCLIIEHK
jgi:hypothetical protein